MSGILLAAKKDAGQAGMTKKKHSIRCPHYYVNESVEKVLYDPNDRNLGGLLPLRRSEIVQYRYPTHSFFLDQSKIFYQVAFSTAPDQANLPETLVETRLNQIHR